MKSRIFHVLISLLLILALVVNVSPLKAHAFSVVPVLVPVAIVATAVLVGVGLSPGSDPSVHANIVDAAVDYLAEVGYVIGDGMIQVQKMIENGAVKFGIDMVIAKVLQDWVYAQGYVTGSTEYGGSTSYSFSSCVGFTPCTFYCSSPFLLFRYYDQESGCEYGVCVMDSWNQYVTITDGSSTDTFVTSYNSVIGGGFYRFYSTSISELPFLGSFANFTAMAKAIPHGVESSFDLTLGDVASQRQDFGSAYPTWTQSAFELTAEDGTATTYVVTGLGATAEETATMSQAEVQSGVSTYVDSTTDTESGTITGTGTVAETTWATFTDWLSTSITGIIDAVVALPTTITQAVADVFTPSQELDTYTMQLSDFFPFCIPFDLYDFLCCLNADPVTPVIDWGVPLPDGSIYPIQIDLSEFDSTAQLFRRLQLLLFCVGLAFKTRDLIKG